MKNSSKGTLKVTLIKSANGRLKNHKAILECLKLRRINDTSVFDDNPCIRGMVNKISYLLKIEE